MSVTVSIEDFRSRVTEILDNLAPGEEIVITRDNCPVAQVRSFPKSTPQPKFGGCRGMLTIVAEDEEHLEDFPEYMP